MFSFPTLVLALALTVQGGPDDTLSASWIEIEGKCDLDVKIQDALKSQSAMEQLYEEYKCEHQVDHPQTENYPRLKIFKQHLEQLERLKGSKGVSWKVGITFMAHMTECEKDMYHGHLNKTGLLHEEDENAADKLMMRAGLRGSSTGSETQWDWRRRGAVTPVKDQIGLSCWAHAAVVPIEAQIHSLTGELRELSTQELVDCTYSETSRTNGRGHVADAWKYMKNHKRLAYRSDVPDSVVNNRCDAHFTDMDNAFEGFKVYSIIKYKDMESNDKKLVDAIRVIGPAAVYMHSKDAMLDTYTGGPYDWRSTKCNDKSIHTMAIVGYVEHFYIIKNSWGRKWGDNGYLWWKRGTNGYNCNLLSQVQMAVIDKDEDCDSDSDIDY